MSLSGKVDRSVRHDFDLKMLESYFVASLEIALDVFGDQLWEKASSDDAK